MILIGAPKIHAMCKIEASGIAGKAQLFS